METIAREIRFAARRLGRTPGFTMAAGATLTLALAVLTTVAALVDVAFLRPLPYADAERLVSITSTYQGNEISVSWPDFRDWREGTTGLDALAAYRRNNVTLTGRDGPAERLRGLEVTADLFELIGVAPSAGRAFGPGSDAPGAPREVILGHGLWVDRYGADPGVVGRSIILDGEAWTVIGVMPEGFDFPDGIVLAESDLFLPVGPSVEGMDDRQQHAGTYALGRLARGRTIEDARTGMEGLAAELARRFPDSNADESVRLVPALERVVGDAGAALLLLALAGGLVLLVACANVSGLFLARAAARHQEYVVRSALGASRRRITLQLLVEAGLVALAGGIVGLLVARVSLETARPLLSSFPRIDEAAVDLRVAAAALAAAGLSAVLVALVPVARLRWQRLGGALMTRSHGGGGGGGGRGRSALVAAQVAVAAVLLVSAGVLARGFGTLVSDEGGIRAGGVLTFQLSLPDDRYARPRFGEEADPAETLPGADLFFGRLEESLGSLPGVEAVGGISVLPFSGSGAQAGITPVEWDLGEGERPPSVDVAVVRPGYWQAMGVELLRGRTFEERDGADAPWVVVVDERLAELFWPGEDPLGRRVTGWGVQEAIVVGVVRHVKNYGVGRDSRAEMYFSHDQRAFQNMFVVVRTDGDPAALGPRAREIVGALEPNAPVTSLRTMREVVDGTIEEPRLAAVLGGGLAAIAALLAVLGMYAMLAYAVTSRTREIGVRMALGAPGRSVMAMVVGHGVRLAAVGALAGLVLAQLLMPLLEPVVRGAQSGGPALHVAVAAAVLGVSILAAWIPARRAASVHPVEALRE